MRPLGALGMADGDQRLLQQLLQVRLPDVDDVVDVGRAAERRMVVLAVGRCTSPTAARAAASTNMRYWKSRPSSPSFQNW